MSKPYIRDPESLDVREFQRKFGHLVGEDGPRHLTRRKLLERVHCLREELDELERAVEQQDLAEQVDALVDLVYFAKGTALMLGVVWDLHWDVVQRANLSKVRGVKPERGHLVDCVKPEGWTPPDHMHLLLAQGYEPSTYFDDAGCFIAEAAHDDPEHL